jgi:2-isopropylmalate synthase
VNIPDTVGYSIPSEWGEKIRQLILRVPNIKKAVVSVHCHNDLGLAVANSLAAVQNGARQVECTVNGIGERAGNASLEEIVMSIRTRKDLFQMTTGVNTKEIARASRLISKLTGITVQPNKAVVGANAFAHSSGIHQDGVLKSRTTYEIMNPADVGVEESALLLTARSGRNGVQNRLKHLGYTLDGGPKLDLLFAKFKTLADKKKYVFDDDLLALVEEEGRDKMEAFHLDYMSTTAGTGIVPTATVRLKKEDDVFQEASCRGWSCGRGLPRHGQNHRVETEPERLRFALGVVRNGRPGRGGGEGGRQGARGVRQRHVDRYRGSQRQGLFERLEQNYFVSHGPEKKPV